MPNPAQLHLLVNHLPVFAPFLAIVVYSIAWARRGDVGAFLSGGALTILGGIGAFAADQTGDGAYDQVKALPGVVQDVLDAHAEAADWAVGAGVLAAIVLGAVLVVTRKAARAPAWAMALGLVLSGVQAATAARVAHLGGLIRHPEIVDK